MPVYAFNEYRQVLGKMYPGASISRMTLAEQVHNRAVLYDMFSYENWNSPNMTYDLKEAALQCLENDFAFQQGRPWRHVDIVSLKDEHYGGWTTSDGFDFGSIRINKNLVERGSLFNSDYSKPREDANLQLFDTIAHEGYHAYQSYAIEHPEIMDDKERLRSWYINKHGEYYENGEQYYLQPLERDAWAYGHSATVSAFNLNSPVLCTQPEACVSEYKEMSERSSYENQLAIATENNPNILENMDSEMVKSCHGKGLFEYNGNSLERDNENSRNIYGSLDKDTAFKLLGEYMGSHNYGRQHYDIYSKDPEWQKLHSAAYPEYHSAQSNDIHAINDSIPESQYSQNETLNQNPVTMDALRSSSDGSREEKSEQDISMEALNSTENNVKNQNAESSSVSFDQLTDRSTDNTQSDSKDRAQEEENSNRISY